MKSAKKKRKPGPKPTGKTPVITLRLPKELTAGLDAWAAQRGYSRSEGIRQIIDDALARSGSRVSELAGEHLDRHADPTASANERDRRKIRLLKGPEEFREMVEKRRKSRKHKRTGL